MALRVSVILQAQSRSHTLSLIPSLRIHIMSDLTLTPITAIIYALILCGGKHDE